MTYDLVQHLSHRGEGGVVVVIIW